LTPIAVTQLLRAMGDQAATGLYLAGVALVALLAGPGLKRYGGKAASVALTC